MAMTLQGFSIREYAANMRRVDFDKCWPFDNDGGGGGGATRCLPPISIRKFRFWRDELKCEDGVVEEIKPSKGKQRNQKKRSIVELFAVAPPIDGDDDEIKAKAKRLTTKKQQKERKKLKFEICAAKKEKTNKLTSSTRILHKLQGSVHKKLSGKKNRILNDRRKKPSYIKNLAKNHKLKLLQSSKLISKKKREQGMVLQPHNILKNPSKSTVKKAAGAKVIPQGSKDDIPGLTNGCSHLDIPQLRSLCKIFSDVLAASSALGNPHRLDNLPGSANVTQAENGSDINVAKNVIETTDGISSDKELLSVAHSDLIVHRNSSCTDQESLSISMDKNHPKQSYNDADRFIPETSKSLASFGHLDEPRIPASIHSEGLSSHSDIQVEETSLQTSDSPSLTTIGRCISRSNVTALPNFIGNSHPPIDSCWKISELHPIHHRPPRALMESMHPFAPTYKDRCIDLSFIGLPLNSQGELIGLRSGANLGLGEISKSQNALQGSIHSYSAPNRSEPRANVHHLPTANGKFPDATLNQNDRSNSFKKQYFPVSKSAEYGNGFTNLQRFERFGVRSNETLIDKDQNFLHDSNMRGISCHGFREDNRTQNYIDRVNFQPEGNKFQSNIQQTVRLMGTNVTIGRNGKECQGYDGGRICTDKEIVTDNRPPQWMNHQWVAHHSFGMPKNNLCHPLDASSKIYHMPAIAPRLDFSHFDYRPQWISRNGTSLRTRNSCFQVDPFAHPLDSQSSLNETSKSLMTSIPTSYQIPIMASNPARSYQHLLLNSTHCRHGQGITCAAQSSFRPPFLYQETGGSIQPSPSPLPSSPNLPHWLLNAKMQKKSEEYCCSCYTNQIATHQQRGLVPTNVFSVPSPRCTSTISFPVCTASITSERNAVDKSGSGEKLNREGTNFNFTYLKSLDTSVKTRKRPAAKDDVFMKPAKKPSFRMQEDTSASAGIGLAPDSEKATCANNLEIVNETGGLRNVPLSSSLRVHGVPRSGPIKLSAGTKHILKPNQESDQDDSGLIHSTTPFSAESISGKAVKAAEIYRF